ncbi:MAG: glycosyltransferase family 2 protein [Desulfocapsaceae bacterium]
MPAVSVIIPCYNQGAFLHEAVESVRSQTFKDLEIIIVDDGSEDEHTVKVCSTLEGPGLKVIRTVNQGLAAARNNGIAESKGEYILPLDADDKIAPEYISEAVEVLETSSQIGIVYCRARLFGAVEGDWHLPDYSLDEMLKDNIIFCTALFRKSDWQSAGGYDSLMVYGWEDYEFWLSLIERGLGVYRLEGKYFFYRVSPDSMVRSKEKTQKIEMFKRIFQRHQKLFSDHIEVWLDPLLDLREQYLTSRLYVDCGEGVNDSSSITRKIEPGKRTIRFPIDEYENVQALRYDPSDCPVSINLERIELTGDTETRSVDPKRLRSNADYRDGSRFMFSTEDPQIFIDLDTTALTGVQEVVITIDLICYGDEALRAIIAMNRINNKPAVKNFSLKNLFKSRKC